MNEAKWQFKKVDTDVVRHLIDEFDLPEIYARVMALRGISSRVDSRRFFYPDIEQLHDPFLMKDMDTAVDRILDHLRMNRRFLVFGDYDVDGTTGTALLYLFLQSVGGDIQYYIPSREMEGYGLSKSGIDYAKNIGADLLITCDCGINDGVQIEYARQLGIEVIVTDHHRPDMELPNAFAILNPKQLDCPYPFDGLCGAGVAFKLVLALCQKGEIDPKLAWRHADLVALGIAADLVPLVDENRVLVSRGLKLITAGSRVGIQALMKATGLWMKDVTVGRIVFGIAPKINAAGRLGDAARAVKLLTTRNPVFAEKMAVELEHENQKRQEITRRIVDDAVRDVQQHSDLDNENAIVLANSQWHHGVIGIVASKIRETFNRPTFIISIDGNGKGKGSGRSIPGFDLYEALNACKNTLAGFGGHPIAAGLTINAENVDRFRQQFLSLAKQQIPLENLIPTIRLDSCMPLSTIDGRFIRFMNALGPFGPGNMRPKFSASGVTVKGIPRLLGRDSNVLRMRLSDQRNSFDAIGFEMAHHYEKVIQNRKLDIAYEVGENDWNGRKTIQLELLDIKLGD